MDAYKFIIYWFINILSRSHSLLLLLELLGLLATNDFFVASLKFFCQLLSAPLDTLHTHLMITVAFLEISHAQEDRVLHLLLLLLDFFVELRVEHFESWGSVAFALGHVTDRCLAAQVESNT